MNTSVFHTQGVPDSDLGEGVRAPILSLSITGLIENEKRGISEPHWAISIVGDDRAVTPATGVRYPTDVKALLSPVQDDIAQWVTFVIRYKHTYLPDGDIDIWKDGQHVFSKSGIRTAFNDRKGAYIKMGSFPWSWDGHAAYPVIKPGKQQIYLDSVRIAQGLNRYNDVAP